jgi:hypothetical protein
VFEELLGLPAHPLLVHAAVVFVPLLVVAAAAYALVPFVRRWIAWAVVGLAVVAPFAAWFATLSGNAFRERLVAQGLAPEFIERIDEHRAFGDRTLWTSIGLAVLAVLLVAVHTRLRRRTTPTGGGAEPPARPGTGVLLATVALSVGVLILAGVSAYYAYKAGDSGARIVWGTS